jgi:hypothetical protein
MSDNPPVLDRDRLAKLLGMIGSVFDGEALQAARRAHAIVRAADMTWHEVVNAPPAVNDEATSHPEFDFEDDDAIGDAIAYCLQCEALTPWERKFLASVQAFHEHSYLSEKQLTVLKKLVRKAKLWPNSWSRSERSTQNPF